MASLVACDRFREVIPVIFCDGARTQKDLREIEKTRLEAGEWQRRLGGRVVLRDKNIGLAQSVISGVSELCDQYGRVIVVEDDLVLGRNFLVHHLGALAAYEHVQEVWQISGFSFRMEPVDEGCCYFLPIISTWGWSTWKRAWDLFDPASITSEAIGMNAETRARFDIDHAFPYSKMLSDSLHGRNDSWGIRWNWRVFRAGGMVLYPPKSLVHNAGFDGSGSHCNDRSTGWQLSEREVLMASPRGTARFPAPCRVEPEQWFRLRNVLASI
jgi:hypothetical protein